MLTEASFFDSEPPIQGPARVREVQARLPELVPGQRFTATLDRALPDGTFQAIVAGRNYTLALNHAARAGDTLELVVTQSTPKAVFAQLVNPAASAGAEATRPSLSAAGRLISFLLTGQPNPPPAALAGGRPLLDRPAANISTALAPILRQALAQSGLFYESHQLQWLAGKIDVASLLKEPQGQQSARGAPAGQGGVPEGPPGGIRGPGIAASDSAPAQATTALRPGGGPAQAATTGVAGDSAEMAEIQGPQSAAQRVLVVPERILPVVHQQLDALATQQYVLHGQVWPGQNIEWEIEDPDRDREGGGEESSADWKTTLRLMLPRLGGMEARLHLTPAGVALRLIADEGEAVEALEAARNRLDAALAAANVPLTGFVAERRDAAG